MAAAPNQTSTQRPGPTGTQWLEPTRFIESEDPTVAQFATETVAASNTELEATIALFYAVRDGWRYDPYGIDADPNAFRASVIHDSPSAWCTPKSILLTAAARSVGLPARLGFADVRNHLSSERLLATMGTDLFLWHGYSEVLVNDRWFKLSTAFNIELCDRFGVLPLEFDGSGDALFHAFDQAGNQHMEYVNQRGSFDDLPLEEMLADFAAIYPDMISSDRPGTANEVGDQTFST